MNYPESLDFLSSLIDYERWSHRDYKLKLDNFRSFLRKIGNPQENLKKVILIAGTKGKGSTATMIANLLQAHGQRVGLYTSPHLEDYRERIRINGTMISHKQFAKLMNSVKPMILKHSPRITFFEALTTIAFLHFLENENAFNVFEIGLGGRLDATNVTEPELSVITRIGYDHTHMLGKTLPAIAKEKCGILRKGIPSIISSQRPSALRTISREIRIRASTPYFNGKDFSTELLSDDLNELRFRYEGLRFSCNLSLQVLGQHQIENSASALASVELLLDKLNRRRIIETFRTFKMPARIDLISEKPYVILDMCHNPESATALRSELDKHFKHCRQKKLLIGISKEKAAAQIIKKLASFFSEIYITAARLERAESKERLLTICKKYHNKCYTADSTEEGVKNILSNLDSYDLLVVAGSIYVAGEALNVLKTGKRT